MSYAIAPTFEGNRIGVRRLSTLGNAGVMLGSLGAVADTASVLIQNGWDSTLIYGLVQAGATDTQLTDLLNGATDPTTILTQLKAAQSGGINLAIPPPSPPNLVQTALTTQPSTPSPASAPQSPPGSILSYSVSFANTQGTTTSGAIAYLQANLPTYRMSLFGPPTITSSGLLFSAPAFTVNVLDSVGHAFISHVQGVLDMLMQNYTHNGADPSSIQMVTPGGSGGVLSPQPQPQPQIPNLTGWFESNWGYLAAALAAIVIVPSIIKKL